jgi:uncharacterized alkaline shock family protein YloU
LPKREEVYKIEKKAVVELISKVVSEVEGVYSIKKTLFRKNIKIKNMREGKEILLGLVVKRGVSIPLVVEEVQRKLKEEVERTLGAPIKKIDITVKGIKFSP